MSKTIIKAASAIMACVMLSTAVLAAPGEYTENVEIKIGTYYGKITGKLFVDLYARYRTFNAETTTDKIAPLLNAGISCCDYLTGKQMGANGFDEHRYAKKAKTSKGYDYASYPKSIASFGSHVVFEDSGDSVFVRYTENVIW